MIPEFMPEAGDVIEIINNARMSRDFHSKTKKKRKKKRHESSKGRVLLIVMFSLLFVLDTGNITQLRDDTIAVN